MSWTYETIMAALGDEAQAVPGAIVVFRDKHIVVATTGPSGAFAVTDAGRALLDAYEAPVVEVRKLRRTKVAAPAPTPVTEPDALDPEA